MLAIDETTFPAQAFALAEHAVTRCADDAENAETVVVSR